MSEFSEVERRVYGTIRHNTSDEGWLDQNHVRLHLREFEGSEIQQALHELRRVGLIETDEGRYRPPDSDRRIPHPGEINSGE